MDRYVTLAWRKRPRKLKDRRSFISTDGRRFLFGEGIRLARRRVYLRDNGRCVDCGRVLFLDLSFSLHESVYPLPMELSHQKPKSLGGDDSDKNLRSRCHRCHVKHDGHGQPLYR